MFSSLKDLIERRKNESSIINITGLTASSEAYLISEFFKDNPNQKIAVICSTEDAAKEMELSLNFFSDGQYSACVFPELDTLPYSRISPDNVIQARRMEMLNNLCNGLCKISIFPINSILRRLPPPRFIKDNRRTIKQSDSIDRVLFSNELATLGYNNSSIVEDVGEFSIRGAIFDLWSPSHEYPIRLEFDDDVIASIKYFDATSQRNKDILSKINILPMAEMSYSTATAKEILKRIYDLCIEKQLEPSERRLLMEKLKEGISFDGIETLMPLFHKNSSTIIDYHQNTHWIVIEPVEIKIGAEKTKNEIKDLFDADIGFEKIVDVEKIYVESEEILKSVRKNKCTVINDLTASSQIQLNTYPHTKLRELMQTQPKGKEGFSPLNEAIESWKNEKMMIFIIANTDVQLQRLMDMMKWMELSAEKTEFSTRLIKLIQPKHIVISQGYLGNGFSWPAERLVILTESDIFGSKQRIVQKRAKNLEYFTSFAQIEEDDFLVHELHGICVYRGLKHLRINRHAGDFLLLEFYGGDKLYLPVHNLNMVGRYIGSTDAQPGLDKLGGHHFEKCKLRAKRDIEKIAKELLEIYAARQLHPGFSFPQSDALSEEFEGAFPFEETADQLKAIEDIKEDMENPRPMDRLICGDVGYGKTEVAMRAAFKAASAGKQVAVLVPTTVLSLQHYENFTERFKKWPISIKSLSRFQNKKDQKTICESLKLGTTDIIIGTHRLLQDDIKFKNLGLVIIDEEHRFGVKQKEKLKELRKTVDVIAMTATPIPRTLNMSLSGIRDLSLITTPPLDRLSISTHVTRFDEGIIKHAILKELERNGQIFFVHNRVQTISSFCDRLKKIIPQAKIIVAHGQMGEGKLEKVMFDFRHKKFDILLCTTIIESGLDIPSANTIIINRADKMGLAQLYQLRGRVGRSNVRAYAYLLIPEEGNISRIAHKRLTALTRYTELGSGFQIATHDLEIRGSGNILGESQSGHAATIGFELYSKLMERAVRRLKGEKEIEEINPELKLAVNVYLPEEYIKDSSMRIDIYKRLSSHENVEGLDGLKEEIIERFGELPVQVIGLFKLMEIRLLAKELRIVSLSYDKGYLVIQFHPTNKLDLQRVLSLVHGENRKFRLSPPSSLIIKLDIEPKLSDVEKLESIKNCLSEIIKSAIVR